MSSGERPIGAVKGKQPDTEALCQPPPSGPKQKLLMDGSFRRCSWRGGRRVGQEWVRKGAPRSANRQGEE